MIEIFVVQSFYRGVRGALHPDDAIEVSSAEDAERWAARLEPTKVGVVAFSRYFDQATGVWGNAEIICCLGFEELDQYGLDDPLQAISS